MQYLKLSLVIIQIAKLVHSTCVFESEFGFIFNCNFKKSGLFRVRNLGGVKAHFGLGFSLGDELGFPESLGNLEGDKRRALNYKTDPNFGSKIGVLPASALPTDTYLPKLPNSTKRAISPSSSQSRQLISPVVNRPISKKPYKNDVPLMTLANSLPLGVPAFRPIPYKINNSSRKKIANSSIHWQPTEKSMNYQKPAPFIKNSEIRPVYSESIPEFQVLPSSVTQHSKIEKKQNIQQYSGGAEHFNGYSIKELSKAANVSEEAIQKAIQMRKQQLKSIYEESQTEFKIEDSTTTRTPTSENIMIPPAKISQGGKVMNAPIEYYPVGYEKNFDDNFTTKVNLPPTTFECATQKHFPGLYADMDLGCMVFHVCALTDDGLIMKSFLCPESTLFDQTILKCNWWFYVDCSNSKNIYDSNIPISKSYQLMKSLTYFSNYNKNSKSQEDLDVNALKNTVIDISEKK